LVSVLASSRRAPGGVAGGSVRQSGSELSTFAATSVMSSPNARGAGRTAAGAALGRRSGEPPVVSLAAALSWALLHADGCLTSSDPSALTAAIYEFATHRQNCQRARSCRSDKRPTRTRRTAVTPRLSAAVCALYSARPPI
jgi:hypothetical protein